MRREAASGQEQSRLAMRASPSASMSWTFWLAMLSGWVMQWSQMKSADTCSWWRVWYSSDGRSSSDRVSPSNCDQSSTASQIVEEDMVGSCLEWKCSAVTRCINGKRSLSKGAGMSGEDPGEKSGSEGVRDRSRP